MRFSQALIPTLRDAPKDADIVSAKLMFRAGMIRKVASGLYDWLPLGLRVLKKVEQIVREEMNSAGGQEVWLPHVQPKEFWEETGRWNVYGKELLRIKDRKGAEFCFAPTAEEVITDLVRRDVRSYRQLPAMFYQFATKFRDEIRPRFGVMRAREFYMKDAYSFHADESDAEQYYQKVFEAYKRIFTRCGLKFRPVEAETGAIGGSFSHEFMVMAGTGEEEMVSCECGYAANVERAECISAGQPDKEALKGLEDVSTPGAWTVEDVAKVMNAPAEKFIKTMFYLVDGKPVVALVRGDCELNQSKLARFFKSGVVTRMSEEQYSKLADCAVGFAGPVGLKDRCAKHDGNCKIIADHLIKNIVNGISGANKKDFHQININVGRDFQPDEFADLRNARQGDKCPRCSARGEEKELFFSRGIEVGHTFKLGTKYSESMKAVYLDEGGKSIPFVMGCYGIGVSRVVAAAIEQCHDDNGIVWPSAIAPYQVSVVPVNYDEAVTREWCDRIYAQCQAAGIDTLLDDRRERAGIKFKDADLLGIPVRVTVSEKGIANQTVEIKKRSEKEPVHIPESAVLGKVQELLKT